jgi:putative transcriptional regulator
MSKNTLSKPRKYKSDVKAAIHEMANGLHDAGLIDRQTMRGFDNSCLTPIHEFSAGEIKALREREDVSQSVFASYLNVTKDSVSKWERGQKRPAGPSLKRLSLVERKGLKGIA